MASDERQTRKRLKRDGVNVKPNKGVITGMKNELLTQIMVLLNERAASRPEICKELGASPNKVRWAIEVLKKCDPPLAEEAFVKPVRGTVEKFFRATTRAFLDDAEWSGVPDVIKGNLRAPLLDMIMDDAVAALSADTYDSLEDAHMSWLPMIIDEQGWKDLVSILRRTLKEAEKVKEDSEERLLAEDAKGVSCTVSILGYPSANAQRKVGPTGAKKRASDLTKDGDAKAAQTAKRKTRVKKDEASAKGKARKGPGKAAGKRKKKADK
jgi:hypothetical protein